MVQSTSTLPRRGPRQGIGDDCGPWQCRWRDQPPGATGQRQERSRSAARATASSVAVSATRT
ncbi:hypothetical protein ACFFX0_07920 [Citricoccus parietis]|uniref:Uncharacterized protein n=1 Tax=Citricoccus parietis TaxID=592307 RepID=A0ABV5FWQ4_9MICC